ncbi:DNA topoisomerase IB [Diaminobutyricimonas sp. LJ205]|uniref:DNA topoisomerase IB n=1 Tax=Diaminobutyricimonas sp. LJ205 TaxID=2683590 RepID=UPI0012F48234|nr:DNA topoisomerase IB [Diaminobutyricimonas sp. LJ205]
MPRLRRSDASGTGFTRVRSGRGFSYRDADGETVTDPELRARFESLAIPPAWTNVWICPWPNGHIQATGVDTAGRRQYLYHPGWREKQDRSKYDRALALAESLPTARRLVTIDLRRNQPDRERALATAFRMLDTGRLRIGSEQYAAAHGSIGLCTLLGAHARVSGDTVALEFPGKSGQEWSSEITDADLASVVQGLKRRGPRARLLAYRNADAWHPLVPAEINDYVRERTGGDFTAKDFRTLHGTVAAAKSLAKQGPMPTHRARAMVIAQAMRDAADELGNTPAIARKSYVDPRLVDHYLTGETIDPRRLDSAESELRALLYE